MQLNRLKYE
jgi:ribosome-interacting GTPase 1